MDTLKSLDVFRQVVELGSFVKAAEYLNISTAMASKHIKHLEDSVQAKLLNRSSRAVSLTEAGTLYYQQISEALDTLNNASLSLQEGVNVARGRLKITAPVWFSHHFIVEKLAKFQEDNPCVQLSLNLNDQHVDLVSGGYDLALRVTQNPPEHLIARKLSDVLFYWVASPTYLEKFGTPETLADLKEHKGIAANFINRGLIESVYNDSNNTLAILQMALQGMGVTVSPAWLVDEEVKSGRLVRIVPHESFTTTLYAIYPERKFLSQKTRAFIDHMLVQFK